MAVPMKRYQRRKILNDETSPLMYYLRQDPGSYQTCTIKSIASKIEVHGALTREDVIHSINAFVRLLQEELVVGNKVKVDGLGIFHITTNCTGAEKEEDCTVRNIKRVNLRFMVDNELRLVNETIATTRNAPNNVSFYIKGDKNAESGGGGDDVEDPTA